jgi:hypothetical protein
MKQTLRAAVEAQATRPIRTSFFETKPIGKPIESPAKSEPGGPARAPVANGMIALRIVATIGSRVSCGRRRGRRRVPSHRAGALRADERTGQDYTPAESVWALRCEGGRDRLEIDADSQGRSGNQHIDGLDRSAGDSARISSEITVVSVTIIV